MPHHMAKKMIQDNVPLVNSSTCHHSFLVHPVLKHPSPSFPLRGPQSEGEDTVSCLLVLTGYLCLPATVWLPLFFLVSTPTARSLSLSLSLLSKFQ